MFLKPTLVVYFVPCTAPVEDVSRDGDLFPNTTSKQNLQPAKSETTAQAPAPSRGSKVGFFLFSHEESSDGESVLNSSEAKKQKDQIAFFKVFCSLCFKYDIKYS